ncbi:MAG: LamG domain-containing protein, partial [Candidatus Bathyarchaeota archaeon]|nr:LamG domain-containing protein [Candidatus Bathyarchaeota archaeon]
MSKIWFGILTGTLLLLTLVSGSMTQSASAEEGLLAYWKFDEGSGTTAYDSSGNNNHGTIHEATWTTGQFGYALKFDGVDDYVGIPDLFSSSPSVLTVSAWINSPLDSLDPIRGGGRDIVRHFWNGEFTLSGPGEDVGTVLFGVKLTDGYAGYNVAAPTTANVWHNVTGVWVKGSSKLYVDNVLRAQRTLPDLYLWHWGLPASIGSYGRYAGFFNGTIDEVKIYAWGPWASPPSPHVGGIVV